MVGFDGDICYKFGLIALSAGVCGFCGGSMEPIDGCINWFRCAGVKINVGTIADENEEGCLK